MGALILFLACFAAGAYMGLRRASKKRAKVKADAALAESIEHVIESLLSDELTYRSTQLAALFGVNRVSEALRLLQLMMMGVRGAGAGKSAKVRAGDLDLARTSFALMEGQHREVFGDDVIKRARALVAEAASRRALADISHEVGKAIDAAGRATRSETIARKFDDAMKLLDQGHRHPDLSPAHRELVASMHAKLQAGDDASRINAALTLQVRGPGPT